MNGHETTSAEPEASRRVAARRAWIAVHGAVGAAILFVACSSGGPDSADTADSVAEPTTQSATAPAASTAESAATPVATDAGNETTVDSTTEPAADEKQAAQPNGISFADDVQPILENNCASCHTADGPGTAHLNMATAADVDGFDADYIDTVIDVGYMPPWPAADGDVAFHDDRRLTADDLATISAWADDGGALDVEPDTPIVAARETRNIIERDLELQAEPYKGDTNDPDDYRCQVYDPEITEPGWVQGYGIEADRTEVVHHALVFLASGDARESAEAADAEDPDVGWSCTGLAGIGGRGTVKQILSWAPGQDTTSLPSDTGIEIGPDDFFVMQIHYHYEPVFADLAPDHSTLVVDLASDEAVEAAGGSLDPITLSLYLGPAEIPCSTEESGPLCDRDAAIADLFTREGTLANFGADALLGVCGKSVDDFADMTDGIATSTCDLPARPGRIVSIWGHEHEIGKAFKMTLNPDTLDERVLLDIPNWNFDWQLDYRPIEDIVLKPDDVIRVECTWDRSRIDDDAEPRYVLWAEGTDDEMCYSQIVTRPI